MSADGPRSHVREANADDLAALQQLEAACFPAPWSTSALAAELDHPHALVLVVDQPTPGSPALAGFACFRQVVDEAELLRLGVDPACRRRGWGRLLLTAGCRRLRDAGARVLWLEVRADNHSAVALYENLGFVLGHRRKGYYRDGCDALIYQRFL